MNNTILFSIYTNKSGHQVVGFDAVDKNGRNAFDQAAEYAITTYNDPKDKPSLFMLSPLPLEQVTKTPTEWENIYNVTILDHDGWRTGSTLGFKSFDEAITRNEFEARMNESTIRPR